MQRLGLCVGLLLWAATAARGQEAEERPQLVLDSGGHTARVTKILFAPDRRALISVSEDKTIRVWDMQSGETLRVLRPPIGGGPDGMLYAAALSPDGQTLAVGGYGTTDGEKPILLISLATGGLEQVISTGHRWPINALAFSPDGRRLASGSGDQTVRIWNVADGTHERTLTGHTCAIYGVAFSANGRQLATAAFDGTARIWSVTTGKPVAVLRGHDEEVFCVAWSPDGKTIATGSFDDTVRLWEADGTHRRTFDNLEPCNLVSLSFTPDSSGLLFTQGPGTGDPFAGILDVKTGRTNVRFAEHDNSLSAGALSPDGEWAATAGGNDNEIFVWSTSDGSIVHHLVGTGHGCWAAGWGMDGTRIAWGNTNRGSAVAATMPLERSFDLQRLEFGEAPKGDFFRMAHRFSDVALQLGDDPNTVIVERDGRTVTTLKTAEDYDRVRCFTLLSGGRAVVGATFGLYLYDVATGKRLRDFQGHTSEVWAVGLSPDGRYLLSASNDQTLRIWEPERDEPLLSLFFAGNDWIAWTPEGYYVCSPGGERLMGWHVNRGRDQMADFYPAARFRKSLYRPDLIKNLLTAGSVERALELAGESKTDVAEVLPPEVEITSPAGPSLVAKQDNLTVTAKATSRGGQPVTAMALLLDGRPYQGKLGERRFEDGKPGEVMGEWSVTLTPGQHRLAVRAESAVSTAVSDEVEVRYTGTRPDEEEIRPALYVLAVGVADYDDEALRLNYAGNDAQAVDEAFRAAGGNLFRKVETQVLSDKQATRRGIMKGLTWLRKEMTQHDVGVVFFSGHGERDGDGTLYLLPSDVERDDLLTTAVRGETLKDVLRGVPGRVMVLLDACHSGAADAETGVKRKSALTDDLVRDLVTDDFGVVMMCSSTGREFSLESSEHRRGYFTVALTEGLAGKADYNKDAAVYLNELDLYVSERVKELTKGKQHPVTAKPASVRSFPLAQGR